MALVDEKHVIHPTRRPRSSSQRDHAQPIDGAQPAASPAASRPS